MERGTGGYACPLLVSRNPARMISITLDTDSRGSKPTRGTLTTIPTGVIGGILEHQSKRTSEICLHTVDESARIAIKRLEGMFEGVIFLNPHTELTHTKNRVSRIMVGRARLERATLCLKGRYSTD